MKQDVSEYRLTNVDPYLNVFNGWGIRADLLMGNTVIAKVDDPGDGTCPGIDWEAKDSEVQESNINSFLEWYAVADDWYALREPGDGTPDIDEAIWFLRDHWNDSF